MTTAASLRARIGRIARMVGMVAGVAGIAGAIPAGAQQTITVHNTGVGSVPEDQLVAAGQVTAFWTLSAKPLGSSLFIGSTPYRYYNPAYFPDQANAAWVSPLPNGNAGPNGSYTYDLALNLTGQNANSLVITGVFGADNFGYIWANDRFDLAVPTVGHFSAPTPFLLRGLRPGANTIHVLVENAGYPTAFFVRFEQAQSSGLLSTGMRLDGNLAPPGGGTNSWYQVGAPPGVPIQGVYPFRYYNGAYAPDVADAAWVSGASDGSIGPLGTYTFEQAFDLVGLDSSTVVIEGDFSSDNDGALWLNDEPPVVTTGSGEFNAMRPFVISQGFRPGPNRLRVNVTNAGPPTAFFVRIRSISGTAVDFDCSQGCRETTYGLSTPDSYTKTSEDPLAYTHGSFTGSYTYERVTYQLGFPGTTCGPEKSFVPLFGQLILREPQGCRAVEYLPASMSLGCPVEIVSTDPGAFDTGSHIFKGQRRPQMVGPYSEVLNEAWSLVLLADPSATVRRPLQRPELGRRFPRSDGRTEIRWTSLVFNLDQNRSLGCCSDNVSGALCSAQGLNTYPLLTSYPYQTHRSGQAAWIFEADGSFHLDDSFVVSGQQLGVCSADRTAPCSVSDGCDLGVCTGRTCGFGTCVSDPSRTCATDQNCLSGACRRPTCRSDEQCAPVPGQTNVCSPVVRCRANTDCGSPQTCELIEILGTCDLRELGWRVFNPAFDDWVGPPNPNVCNMQPWNIRGRRNQGCSILRYYDLCPTLFPAETCVMAPGASIGHCTDSVPNDGFDSTTIPCSVGGPPYSDPGPGCAARTFGPFVRPDENCDGIEDATLDTNGDGQADLAADLCPYHSETNAFADTDRDGRGDECECSDQTGDGRVTVSDIVAINQAIFSPTGVTPLCDGNLDFQCNVSDIVAANREIFVPGSSHCARDPQPFVQ